MATRSGEKVLLVDANLHGGGGPAVKRRGRRRGGLGGESRGGRRRRRQMRCGAVSLGEERYLYLQIIRNRRSDQRAPSDCLFGLNGVDEVAVCERSSASEKDGAQRPKTCSLTECKTSIKLDATDS